MEKKDHRKKKCWKCNTILNFKDFYHTNRQLTKERAMELWSHPNIELFCCSCFATKLGEQDTYIELREREFDIRTEKILVLGIQNSGKTAVINAIRDKSLYRTENLLPTRGISRESVYFNNVDYIIWDFGGVYRNRRRWIEKSELMFSEAKEMIFFIDIQDYESYNESMDFLHEIVDNREFNQLPIDFRIVILFHKADPRISNVLKLKKYSEILRDKINKLEIPYNYEIFKTSLNNFHENYLDTVFNQVNSFGQLIYELFA